MNRTQLTDEHVYQIYFLWKRENLSNVKIGERLGINPGSVSSAKHYIKEYWQPKNSSKRYPRTPYKMGVQRIKLALMNEARNRKKNGIVKHTSVESVKETVIQPEVAPKTQVKGDRFVALSQAFESFQQSLETFIEAEVEDRTSAVAKELKDTKLDLREAKELLKKAEEAFDVARNSNWVDAMKRKWQNK